MRGHALGVGEPDVCRAVLGSMRAVVTVGSWDAGTYCGGSERGVENGATGDFGHEGRKKKEEEEHAGGGEGRRRYWQCGVEELGDGAEAPAESAHWLAEV
jgi:hypothetical protein